MKNSRSFSSGQIFCTVFFALAALALCTLPARAKTWQGTTSGNFGASTNWRPTPAFNTSTDLAFSASIANASSTSTLAFLGANRIIRSLNFDANADSNVFIRLTSTVSNTTARNLTFQAASGSANLTIAYGATGNYTIGLSTGSVVLGSGLLIDHSGTENLTIDRVISGMGFGMTKNGTGVLTLFAADAFTGGATGGNVTIAASQNLTIAKANTNTSSGSIQGGENLSKTGVGILTLNGSNTYTSATTIGSSNGANAGTLQLSGSGTISNAATTIFGGTLPQI